jgi:hypothetical protein
MTARSKTGPASEQFAAVLREATVETAVETQRNAQRDIRHLLFAGEQRPLWTRTFGSQSHRYLCKPVDPSIQ